jgi:hypothetical protein
MLNPDGSLKDSKEQVDRGRSTIKLKIRTFHRPEHIRPAAV